MLAEGGEGDRREDVVQALVGLLAARPLAEDLFVVVVLARKPGEEALELLLGG
ncbi:MAG: hypothetical protein RML12_10925 [Xanthomonadales bacterium]|nr:hypothetical protein [Xanthomonadales bacterium]